MSQNEIVFSFEGRKIFARPGQSLAGALHGAGVRVLSRSSKFHRPRGYTCGFSACGNCPLTVDGMPSVEACATQVKGGEHVEREQGLPNTGFDLLRVADFFKPLLGAGFQFKLFPKNHLLSAVAGRVMGILAGGGRMPTISAAKAAASRSAKVQECDLLIVGGGFSGLATALGAAEAGNHVIVVDREFGGGRGLVRTEGVRKNGPQISDRSAVYTELVAEAQASERVQLVKGTAVGLFGGLIPIVSGRQRWEVSPKHTVVATGSYETPGLFANNDRPGIMLADGALKLAELERIPLGKRVVVITDSERGHQVAARLSELGAVVKGVVDSRPQAAAPGQDWPVHFNMKPRRAHGWSRLRSVTVAGPRRSKWLRADTLVIAKARRPAEEMRLQWAYAEAGDHLHVKDHSPTLGGRYTVVGTATGEGSYDIDELRQSAAKAFAPHRNK